jgi:peptidoglycan hydrolase-like protein with peptidoglycan-binding domain
VRRKKNRTAPVDEPRAAKPIALVLSTGAFAGACAILFNAFFNQPQIEKARPVAVAENARTRVTVSADDKTSRTITLKYDALVEDVQRELLATGHFNGLVDGVTGPKTKTAVGAYQTEHKLPVTGEVSKSLLEHIQYTRKVNQAAEFTGSVAPEEQPKAKPVVTAPPVDVVKKEQPASDADKAVLRVQERLALLGYEPGSRSGQLDEGTRSAILIFEMDQGLPMQGKISKQLLSALKAVEAKPSKKP